MLTEHESEILGIMFGDGCLSRTEHSIQIAVTGNKVDDEDYFLNRVRPLFWDVFNLGLTVRYRQDENTMDLYRHSMRVALTLHSWGMPFGQKKLSDLTPKLDVVPSAFIRGVFDTDGSVYRKYGPYAQVQFKTVSRTLLCFIKEQLTILGFHPTNIRPDETKHRLLLSRQSEVDAFFRELLSQNTKHQKRFQRIRREAPTSNGQPPSLLNLIPRPHLGLRRWGTAEEPMVRYGMGP